MGHWWREAGVMEFGVQEAFALTKDIPPGDWVAISRRLQKVIAHGPVAEAVFDSAREQGETVPIILRVPKQAMRMFF
jgi:hypothetical protein